MHSEIHYYTCWMCSEIRCTLTAHCCTMSIIRSTIVQICSLVAQVGVVKWCNIVHNAVLCLLSGPLGHTRALKCCSGHQMCSEIRCMLTAHCCCMSIIRSTIVQICSLALVVCREICCPDRSRAAQGGVVKSTSWWRTVHYPVHWGPNVHQNEAGAGSCTGKMHSANMGSS